MIPLYAVLFKTCFISIGRGCNSRRVVRFNPLPVTSAGYVADPILIFEVPAHSLADSTLKRFTGTPAEFAFDLTCVHGVTAVVSGTVFHERDQFTPRSSAATSDLIDKVADSLDN